MSDRHILMVLGIMAVLPFACKWAEDEDYVYTCWPCRSQKYVDTKTRKERIATSSLWESYVRKNPQHQHTWWISHRESRSGLVNMTNGCPMCVITESEQSAFVRSASPDKLKEFERYASSTSAEDKSKAVELIRGSSHR